MPGPGGGMHGEHHGSRPRGGFGGEPRPRRRMYYEPRGHMYHDRWHYPRRPYKPGCLGCFWVFAFPIILITLFTIIF